MKKSYWLVILLVLVLFFSTSMWAGTTGKIAGTVVDKETGEVLPGANIMIVDTGMGAAADLNGQYTILHIAPGVYNLQVSVIGYAKTTVNDVRVNIDQTARVNFELEIEAIEGETVVVVADRTVIKRDVATSSVAVSEGEIDELPVSSVGEIVGMQAGIQGMSIRGGASDEALLLLDGATLRDPRNNQPVSSVALSAIKEISIERGGFNAEYGQVQSGLINVVTREGDKHGYYGSLTTKFSPPAPKYFTGDGIPDVHDPDSYWMRPYLDDAVCWTGTSNNAWDKYTQDQYPTFSGWNEISDILLSDNNPDNDLTPLAAQRVFLYETRKRQVNDQADYNIDGGFGGPVPFISEKLGNLRFFSSSRQNREMLVWPLTRPDYVDYDWSTRLTSDISPSMKLRFSVLSGKQYTMESNWAAGYYPRFPDQIADVASGSHQAMFSDWDFCLTDISHQSYAAKFTHTLNPKIFYELSLEHLNRNYHTRPTSTRDTDTLYEIVPGYFRDENPFGYYPETTEGLIVGSTSHASKARDYTNVGATTFKADITNQLNFNNLAKAGMEIVYNDLDFDYGVIASASEGKTYSNRVQMQVFPVRASMYIQDKLETQGFALNAGVRLDYSNSKTNWWATDPYDLYFFSSKYNESREFEREKSSPQWQLSPRLSISHPITENSKLFFNYGHFKQMPQYESLFRIDRSPDGELSRIGDPNLMLSKTVSYELGYDHLLFNSLLIQMAAFYRDISDQQGSTQYQSIFGLNYTKTTANNYEDIRGFELTLRKSTGRWITGFANYTYQVSTRGHFGSAEIFEDPSRQIRYNEETVNLYQERPIPSPYARASINFAVPNDFGPSLLNHRILSGVMANTLINWSDGGYTTWNPKNDAKVSYNVKVKDYFDTTLRLMKAVDVKKFRIEFLMDIRNLFNTRRLWNTADQDYRESLHLPSSQYYDNIIGDDEIGDYRKPSAEFQPMERRAEIDRENEVGVSRVIYYELASGEYVEYADNAWAPVEKSRLDQILKDKAYIDMPNASTFWFLNPRDVYFGLRITFDLN